MRLGRVAIVLCSLGLIVAARGQAQTENNDSDLLAMRKARDSADVPALRNAIEVARQQAQHKNTANAYEQLALLNYWLCEAAHGKNDDKLIKQGAEDGVEAARKATELDPKSSEAHRLRGDLLGELIPHVFAGGMRYGRQSTSEIEKAIELDPNNVNAYIARAISYFYTPSAFGGSHEKAVEMLKKAISLDSTSDTAHIWLARVYLDKKEKSDALREINEALRLNPRRGFALSVYKQVTGKDKPEKGQSATPPREKGPSVSMHKRLTRWLLSGGLLCFLGPLGATYYCASTQDKQGDQGAKAASKNGDGDPRLQEYEKRGVRFDMLVRADFFAGMFGDNARLERGIQFCEKVLAKHPQHAEALVWHGGGLLSKAAQAYEKGDSALGDQLFQRGLKEMDDAKRFEPENMGVRIGRAAALIGISQSGFDPADKQGRELLESAALDYEQVLARQGPRFATLGMHNRGELLFGLASAWSMLGNQSKTRAYLERITVDCRGSSYEQEALNFLRQQPMPVVRHDCQGCHVH